MGLRAQADAGVRYCHVAGHTGDCPNELADGLANVGSRGVSSTSPFQFQACDWLANQAAAARWLPHICLARRQPAALPELRDGLMVWTEKQPPPAMSAAQLLSPFLRAVPAATESGSGRKQSVLCRCVSFNALSLLQVDDVAAGRAAGLHGAVGRVALLRSSLRAHDVLLAGIQEARTDQGCCHNEEFARYCSGGTERRCLGVELWIARGPGWPAHRFVVRHVDPRRLMGRLDFVGSTYNVLVGHAPHRGHSVQEREEWWRRTSELCLGVHDGLDWILLLDGNCRVGSVASECIGAHQSDVQDEGGACMHALAGGPGGTFLQKQSQELQRCDFVGLPERWKTWQVRAWIEPSISSGHAAPDHFASVAECELVFAELRRGKSAARIDPAALQEPRNADRIIAILNSIPEVDWSVNVNDHASTVVEHLFQSLVAAFSIAASPYEGLVSLAGGGRPAQ